MTLSLYILRHAKAEDRAAGGDHERVLRRRGRKAAEQVGRFLARLEEAPDLVLCSSAVRARETAEGVCAAGGFAAPPERCPAIYEASAETLLRTLQGVEAKVTRLLLVGHQPGLGLLVALLTGSEPEFPTAALARIDLERARWSEVVPRDGRLVWLVTPDAIAALRPRSRR